MIKPMPWRKEDRTARCLSSPPLTPELTPPPNTWLPPNAPPPCATQNQAELTEEEDSSLFFVQLPTKLPRPLPAFQRAATSTAAKDGGGGVSSSSAGAGKGKGKGKASGELGASGR